MPTIPQIFAEGPHTERLGVPEAPRVPLQNPVSEAAQRFGEQMSAIGDALTHQQQTIDATNALTTYRGQAMAARDAALKQPYDPAQPGTIADQQIAAYNKAADPTPLLKNPANAHIAPLLAIHAPEIQQQFAEEVHLGATKNWENQQLAQADTGLNALASQYPQVDTNQRAAIQGQAKSIFDNLQQTGAMNADDRVKAEHQWRANTDLNAIRQQMMTDPSGAAMDLAGPDFLARHPYLTAENQMQLRNEQITQADYAQHQINSALTSQASQLEQGILQKQAAGQPIGGDLETLGSHYGSVGGVGEFYRSFAGHDYRQDMPSAPGVEGFYQEQLKGATRETIGNIQLGIQEAVASGQLNRKAGAVMLLQARQASQSLKDDHNSDVANAWSGLRDKWLPPSTPLDRLANMNAPRITPATLEAHWKAALGRNKGDVVKAAADVNKEMNEIGGKSSAAAGSIGRLLNGK